MPIYDIFGNAIFSENGGTKLSSSQMDSVYGLINKTAFISNIENEKKAFDEAFHISRDNLYPLENVDSNFTYAVSGYSFHAKITRGYHVSLVFHQYDNLSPNFIVSFARMNTYMNAYDNLPSMYTFPPNVQIEIGVSNIVKDGITNFAIRNRLANSSQNGNVRTGVIESDNDFKNILTLTTEEQTGSLYCSALIEKAEASLQFDFNLKVGDELWV